MALKKPLVLGSDGSIEQLQSGDQLDIDLSGAGSAGDTIDVTIAENTTTGSVLCATASGIVNADKDDDTKVYLVGIATASANSGDTVSVRVSSQMGGLNGLTPGSPLFLGNSGQITQTIPTFGTVIRLGVAISATDIIVELSQPIKL